MIKERRDPALQMGSDIERMISKGKGILNRNIRMQRLLAWSILAKVW